MARTIKIEIEGMDEVREFLKTKNVDAINKVQTAIKQATSFLQDAVKSSIAGRQAEPRSVDTGEFLNSVEHNTSGFDGVVFSNVPQSLFMEYGTTRIPERRHFRNSKARNEDVIKEFIEIKVKEIST